MNTELSPGARSAPIVIIGAGIVGIAAALHLQRDGRDVVVIDMEGPAAGASYGNAGCLNPSSVVPVGMPGTIAQVPGWLTDPLGPLAIRPSYLPRLVPWLWQLWRASTPARVAAIAHALKPLLGDSVGQHRALAHDSSALGLVQSRGHLVVYSTEAGWHKDAAATALREASGIRSEVLEQDALRELEPDLSPEFIRARLFVENGHVVNPGRYVEALAGALIERGGHVRREKAIGFETDGSRVTAVRTSRGREPCSHVVLAAGAWSKPLALELGDAVPLDTERGYHLMVQDAETAPRTPTMWYEGKLIATPMEAGLRFAGMVEFAGIDALPNWARADRQLEVGRRMLPALPREIAESRITRWLGFRPSLPDSLPVIGRSKRYANAIHAFGHGHVGFAAGPMTGGVVADLIAGRPPRITIEPFSAARF